MCLPEVLEGAGLGGLESLAGWVLCLEPFRGMGDGEESLLKPLLKCADPSGRSVLVDHDAVGGGDALRSFRRARRMVARARKVLSIAQKIVGYK